jgi:hypothetical protein
VARWTGIQPGADGSFTVRAEAHPDADNNKAYAFDVFMLQEEAGEPGPTITITETPLSEFSSEPGTPSTEQSYTVAGSNLTADIVITAPADFEISTTSGDDFGSSLTLPQTEGSVAATIIYVRFNRATEGTSSGEITHASAGATTQTVAVNGTAGAVSMTITFQEGENGYSGTVDTFIMESDADTSYGGEDWVEWDNDDPYNSGDSNFGLIRFDNIFGAGTNQIPVGANIESATLTYVVSSGDYATGDSADVNEVAIDWAEDVTYNGFGAESGVQADDYGTSVGTANGSTAGAETVDVMASLIVWASDPSANHGWIFRPTGSDGVEFRSSEYETISERPLLTVTYTTGPVNQAPAQPTLVRPLNGVLDVSVPPTLEVTVTDPDDDTLDVTFYGREVGTGTSPGEDFTIIALPDTQGYSDDNPDTYFIGQTQWIVDNQDDLNIVYVAHEGDIVNTYNSTTQWNNADAAMSLLEDPLPELADGIPYGVVPGNHDTPTTYYNNYFGVSRFDGRSYYGGHYSTTNDNNYTLFSAGGMDFIVVNFEYQPGTNELDWADDVLKTYPNRQAIVVSHSIIDYNNNWTHQAIYTELKDNPNLFLMLCGHMHTSSDGAGQRTETGDSGNTIYILMADYQDYPSGGNGYLRVMEFSPTDGKIYVQTYSPSLPGNLTDAENQFELVYDMAGSGSFVALGTVSDVASGNNASISWPDLDPDTEYEWYVEVSDGSKTTDGLTWNFTTGSTSLGILGDVNGDGSVNSTDALIVLSCDVGLDTSLFCPMNCGDVNADGLVNSTDALIILSYDVGMEVSYPVGEPGCPSSVASCGGCSTP